MKKLSALILVSLVAIGANFQTQENMSYQAVIRDANGNILTNTVVGMRIIILQGSVAGTAVYEETHTPTTDNNGLISIEIGGGTVITGTLVAVDWTNGPYFIKSEIDLAGGTNYTIVGTSQLLSVPYALHATSAESITAQPDPVNPQDAATKAYVDQLQSQITTLENNLIPVFNHGTETLSCSPCTGLVSNGAACDFCAPAGIPSGGWYLDWLQSNVFFEFPFRALGSTWGGRFNYFVLQNLNFDEGVPSNITFDGYVRLNYIDTGQIGRDGDPTTLTSGCILSTFGLTYGVNLITFDETENIASLVSIPGTGRYNTTDESILVDANFTFHGFTKQVVVKLFYKPSYFDTVTRGGISAEFDFFATTDFGILSTNVGDKIKIRVNLALRQQL